MSFCSSFLFSIDELVAGLDELVSLLQPTKIQKLLLEIY